jgi:hypothetical protein
MKLLLQSWKSMYRQPVIKFCKNWFKQEINITYCLWSTNSLTILNNEEFHDEWKGLLLYEFTRRVIKLTVIIIVGYHCYQLHIKFFRESFSRLSPYIDEITRNPQCGFRCNRSGTDQIFCICQILEEKWEYNETSHKLFIDFKRAYYSVRREVL